MNYFIKDERSNNYLTSMNLYGFSWNLPKYIESSAEFDSLEQAKLTIINYPSIEGNNRIVKIVDNRVRILDEVMLA